MKKRCPRCNQLVRLMRFSLLEEHVRPVEDDGARFSVRCGMSSHSVDYVSPYIDFLREEGLVHGTAMSYSWGCRCWHCIHQLEVTS